MLAIRIHKYGTPEVLRLEEIDKPSPGPHDVLVRVRATSVNPVDWKIRSGYQRNIMRYRLPWTLGLDVSGVVEAVGREVTRFKVGDEVYASPTHSRPGTYAEYICIDEGEVGRKPANLTHEEAASIPLVGLTAYQCVVEKGALARGERILIHAGAGGVGSFGIQLAKHLGAHVTTTASARNTDFVKELGADEVIDYQKNNFADVCDPVDLVFDTLGESVFDGNVRVLRRGGRLMTISMDVPSHVKRFGTFFSLFTLLFALLKIILWPYFKKGVRSRNVIKRPDGPQLDEITKLIEAGAIRPVIDRILPLSEIQEAHRYSETLRSKGKIVLKVSEA